MPALPEPTSPPRLLITAGPTYEPIDAVRFIGNRSSGRLGLSLAQSARQREWRVTLLLGPNVSLPDDSSITVRRFHSTTDLDRELHQLWPEHDILIMAAAVADYRPTTVHEGKLRRDAEVLTLELEPTPDLLRGLATLTRSNQLTVGFALESEATLLDTAREKLRRKRLDAIVANPLETMDGETIRAWLLTSDDQSFDPGGAMSKPAFADWLLDKIADLHAARLT